MGWFRRHLNLTWVMAVILLFSTVFFSTPIPYLICWILMIITTIWALKQKGQSAWWVFIPIAVLFLRNKKEVVAISSPQDVSESPMWGQKINYGSTEFKELLHKSQNNPIGAVESEQQRAQASNVSNDDARQS
jgi:hypothetical protein